MQLIDQRDWAWTLYADGERRYLSVLCGTIAMWELTLELDAGERARIAEPGFWMRWRARCRIGPIATRRGM